MNTKKKVLVVSNTKDTHTAIKDILPPSKYSPIIHVSTFMEAKEKLRNEIFHFVLIQTPIQDEFGVRSAQEIAHYYKVGVLLFVKADIYDQVNYKLKESGVFVISKPCSKQSLYQAMELLDTMQTQLQKKELEIYTLKKKMQEEKMINRAKMLLIEKYHYSEEKAHHALEKAAMDHGKSKVEIAKALLLREN